MNDSESKKTTRDLISGLDDLSGGSPAELLNPAGTPPQIGRYRVERQLGKGGFGLVYLAWDEQLERHVAVKLPHQALVSLPGAAEAYLAEARTVAGLDHPHIVPVYDVGSSPQIPCYIVSKYIPGTNLAQRLKRARPSWAEAAELVALVADTLHYAHKLGLVHRDIKPGNILVDTQGVPYVADFGLALREGEFGRGPRYAGTPAYMSPEQARGEGHRVDGRSDIYSLGAVLYLMLTGRRTFMGKKTRDVLMQIASREPRPPRQIDDTIPRELERICLKALAPRASERYTTARDMAEDLRAFYQHQSTMAEDGSLTWHTSGHGVRSHDRSHDSSLSDAASPPLRVVPRGLRSFDQRDSDFFIDLLPGPRDRDGLPECLRFWSSRIAETDPEQTFSVGLIYGPSGCGKSSLVRAGLLPRLPPDAGVVYLEATPENTESRLLRALRRRFAELPAEADLAESLAALRRRESGCDASRVLVVLDQFEQWLHTHRELEQSELVAALRQCDGARLQCIVMVRDDFWMAVTRFLQELEVGLIEHHNMAAVDLFPEHHARKVLAAFGRAYGALPAGPERIASEQNEFLRQAVAGLAVEGKVICVRLALFAEMMKYRPWTPESLREMGGTQGVGVRFLEETFRSSLASPDHRYHLKAARRVLQTLLPAAGTDIKGEMQSYDALLWASGYSKRPRDFEDLIRILDSELRLITPADPSGVQLEDAEQAEAPPTSERCYQLTHDYLVPSLREWLTRKQRETRRGRAELRLAERATYWAHTPESRYLPGFWETLSIALLTRATHWNAVQQQMMRRAGRRHLVRTLVATAAILMLGAGYREVRGRWQAESKLNALLHAPAASVPAAVSELATHRRWVDPRLRQRLADATARGDAAEELHLRLALLPVDPGQWEFVFPRLLKATPAEVDAIRQLATSAESLAVGPLWALLGNENAEPGERLRAACCLAGLAPDDPRWNQWSGFVADRLAHENAFLIREWAELLKPVAGPMLPALAELVVRSDDAATHRRFAELYAELARGQPRGYRHLESMLSSNPAEQADPIELARQHASAAAALAIGNRWEYVWPLLQHVPDPTCRTFLIERLGNSGIPPAVLLERLQPKSEAEISERRALLLVLGDMAGDRPERKEAARVLDVVLPLYREHLDPGIRGAADWMLRRWGHDPDSLPGVEEQLTPLMVAVGLESRVQNATPMQTPFRLSSREVTVANFLQFRSDHQWDRRAAQSPSCPVNQVTWYDAAAYCNWLSEQAGLPESEWCYAPNDQGQYAAGMRIKVDATGRTGFRLPTAAEWEFACRAGSVTYFSFGQSADMLDRYAWSMQNAGVHSWPVAQLRPNDFGLFDMHGNVWEWCHDLVDDQGASLPTPAGEQVIVDDQLCAMRGGTYLTDPLSLGSATANWNRAAHQTNADGFRIAQTLPPGQFVPAAGSLQPQQP